MVAIVGVESFASTKRSLLALSHAMERSLEVVRDTRDDAASPLVIGLFQRAEYFEDERKRYGEMAAAGALCIVGFVGGMTAAPEGVHAVGLSASEELAGEWAVIVIDGGLGTALVARESHDVMPGEATLEAARLFQAQWSFSPRDSVREATRILHALGDRLEPHVREQADAALARAAATTPSLVERQLAAVTELLVTSIDAAHNRSAALRAQVQRERQRAEHDTLTGLHNRRYLERYLHSSVADSPVKVAALLIDLDGLKDINDRLGHSAGDAALAAVADSLLQVTRPQDVVVRLGGDEFLVVLPGLNAEAGVRVGNRILEHLQATRLPDPWHGVELRASVGVTMSEANRVPLEALDRALYQVKRSGKGRVHFVEAADLRGSVPG